MCGRFMIFDEQENEELRRIVDGINERLRGMDNAPKLKTGEIFPTDYIPAVALKNNGDKHTGLVKWGFPGFQNKGVIINARAETLGEKPTFRRVLKNRCIIPATGYFEWQQTSSGKVKHLIKTDTALFYMAGLYNTFLDKDGKNYVGAVIITTEPAAAIAHIHNRMPAILRPEQADAWLKSTDCKQLLLPYQEGIYFSVA